MSKTVSSRWYVEIFPQGAASSEQRYCVEADRWKSALKKARALAGQQGPVGNLISEARDGGHRLREPSGSVRYFVSKAPAGTPLGISNSKSASPKSTSTTAKEPPKQQAKAVAAEAQPPGKPRFRRLFRIFSSLRPPLRVSQGSRHRSAPLQPSSADLDEVPSVADADAATGALPSSPWASSPLAAPARPGEYLIGKLFEQMHGLHFMPDLVSGANFVADVLAERIPCAGLMIHVFDINRREFVVVRARGPRDEDVLLHRSPDDHAIFVAALRREAVLHVDPRATENFDTVRFNKLGVVVTDLLCGPVHHGRRYLGVIELTNPLSDRFSEAQEHALEYVCHQFADFVASHPVVIDEEAVLASRSTGVAG